VCRQRERVLPLPLPSLPWGPFLFLPFLGVLCDTGTRRHQCRTLAIQGDCGKEPDCKRAVATADKAFGRIDGLVNCAGITTRGSLLTTEVSTWDTILNVNLRGPYILTQQAALVMKREARGGAVVNISSVHSHGGGAEHFAYGTSKSGLNYITKHSAGELLDDGIRLNAINVGWCLTPSEDALQKATAGEDWLTQAEKTYPTGKLISPEDVAITAG
jgi:NAD(P)-dependent dehydrogenase (short-subunit alcohol dehydrogenase family)